MKKKGGAEVRFCFQILLKQSIQANCIGSNALGVHIEPTKRMHGREKTDFALQTHSGVYIVDI